ncbi:ATP-binding cassette domain-containing protein [Legionella londiniensis]|uniref:ATP-binding protein Uup n=1 Tax=Legionella londiniensis TaxID=45068 RepID=A0A0W0VRF1_9GAMM|nr:ATP-binding cassette domain-containing protein [Legionella londiniensis]KTD22607.1 ABC transporter ATP-binding protein [Legionella londiniensis]STX92538.1 ABC transporter ATP-binding protein [Legionella londiniensis]
MSIISLHRIRLNIAGKSLLDEIDWQIGQQERIALVGRNGAGKSTLLRLLQGQIVPDSGQMHIISGLRIAGLTQEIPENNEGLVYDYLTDGLGKTGEIFAKFRFYSKENDAGKIAFYQQQIDGLHAWDILPKIESMASRLGLDLDARMQTLSGGKKRQVLLAAALVAEPDLLLLDEPTNHLDLNAIEWLESYLKNYSGSVLLITHDREFLKRVATRIVEIDRGQLYPYDCDYDTYLKRREDRLLAEEKQHQLFDKQLSEEEAWIRQGIKARRTRNEGRVRALKAMREAYKQRRKVQGQIKSPKLDTALSGQLVIEANHLNYSIAGKSIVDDFSLLLARGDKVGIIGPNGCGKTTLVRLLLGELKPDSGNIRHGTNLAIAYFDQLRSHLDEQKTVMANVADGAEFVTVNGKSKHVASYLRDFLFPPETFNQPVSVLSGGERNRLVLAKLFAKPFNLLVMDEPTNDLDIETLELLEALLVDYKGTLLLISHDRMFINHVVTSVLVYEGKGRFNEYPGGYDEYQLVKKQQKIPVKADVAHKRHYQDKLTYNEQRELSQLPKQIELHEKTIERLQLEMTEPAFYQQSPEIIAEARQRLEEAETKLSLLYERWEELEIKQG